MPSPPPPPRRRTPMIPVAVPARRAPTRLGATAAATCRGGNSAGRSARVTTAAEPPVDSATAEGRLVASEGGSAYVAWVVRAGGLRGVGADGWWQTQTTPTRARA